MGLLTVKEVLSAKVEGNHKWRVISDGSGLYLRVGRPPTLRAGDASKYWVAKVTFKGQRVEMGLGSFPEVSLADARQENETLRVMARNGKDPRRRKVTDNGNGTPTFAEAVDTYLAEKTAEFQNAKHIQQWHNSLREYAVKPKSTAGLGCMKVDDIEPGDVVRMLKPIWQTKTETATRVRGRIEKVLAWATVNKYRTGENPARWKGNIEFMLPKPSKLKQVKHHEALPWADLPGFMADLGQRDSKSSYALQFLILTGARSGEARDARWCEIDHDAGVWTIPAERMNMGKEHVVPLSSETLVIVHRVKGLSPTNVFPGLAGKGGVSEAAVRKLLKQTMGRDILTMHGFRTTLRTWMQDDDRTNWEVGEAILAHSVGNTASQAYARSTMLDRRREVLNRYAIYATS